MEQSVEDIVTQLYAGLRSQPGMDFESMFAPAMQAVENTPAPAQRPVPGAANPLGAAAATFFGGAASNISRNPAFLQAVQGALARHEEERKAIDEENFARKAAYDENQSNKRLSLMFKINELKAQEAMKNNDLTALEQSTKANFKITESIKKADQKAKEQAELSKERRDLVSDLIKIKANKEKSPDEAKAASEDKEDRNVLKFQEDIESVVKLPGNTLTEIKGKFLGLFGNESEMTKLTPQGLNALLSRSYAVGTSAGGDRLKRTALETYFQALSQFDPTSPEYAKGYSQLDGFLKIVYPDPKTRKAWAVVHGLAK